MSIQFLNASEGVLRPIYRNQLLTTLSVALLIFCYGIALGWLAPMIVKLQSDTPLTFSITVAEASWIGALISGGGLFGNLITACLVDRIGRKPVLYSLAIPHMLFWMLLWSAKSVEYLYVARVCNGLTGGGIYVVVPLFIAEIAHPTIRGRLTSSFPIALNVGILVGIIFSSYLPYHVIPWIVIALPLLYLLLLVQLPETPQHLLRKGLDARAKESYKFYHCPKPVTKLDVDLFEADFAKLRLIIEDHKAQCGAGGLRDFYDKRVLKALAMGVALSVLSIYCGMSSILTYMTSIFSVTKSELHPDTNTIIIGVVQIAGTYIATILVDRSGRRPLLIISTAGMFLGLATFGTYTFFAEETDVNLSALSWWMPLTLMAIIVFVCNIGILPLPLVVLVEIMPSKVRSRGVSFCVALQSIFAFSILKAFPVFQDTFGLAATIWFCTSICALGLLFVSLFLEETKGKCVDYD